jgi:catechol 2,3-dioxygenase-like lactoylglutathione lyase family enzyme
VEAMNEYQIKGLLHFGYTVEDRKSAVDFYTKILGFEECREQNIEHPYIGKVTGIEGSAINLAFINPKGEQTGIELLEYVHPNDRAIIRKPGQPLHVHMGYLSEDIQAFYKVVKERGAKIMCPIQTIDYGFCKGRKSFGIEDPLGNFLQIIEAEEQTNGQARLCKAQLACFSVARIEKVLGFFTSLLGFSVTLEDVSQSMYLSNICSELPKRVVVCKHKTADFIVELWETEPLNNKISIRPSVRGNLHLCFKVNNIEELFYHFKSEGIRFVSDQPAEVMEGINKGAKSVYFTLGETLWMEVYEKKEIQ